MTGGGSRAGLARPRRSRIAPADRAVLDRNPAAGLAAASRKSGLSSTKRQRTVGHDLSVAELPADGIPASRNSDWRGLSQAGRTDRSLLDLEDRHHAEVLVVEDVAV
jgi:hypothetical protein